MDSDTKTDLVIAELKNICRQLDERFAKVDENFEKIDKRFEQIDARFEQIDERFEQIDSRLNNLEKRFDKFEEKNESEHKTMLKMLNTLNSAFLRFEAEQNSEISYLLEADKERKEHQTIYAHEFSRLNDLVAKNSFRISNLEQHSN